MRQVLPRSHWLADKMYQTMENEALRQISFRDKIINWVRENIEGATLHRHPTQRLPNNVNLGIPNVEGESLLLALDMEGIAVSTASACSSKTAETSHVLVALGLSPEQAQGSLPITLGKYTTEEDVDFLLEKLEVIVNRLRGLSPVKYEASQSMQIPVGDHLNLNPTITFGRQN